MDASKMRIVIGFYFEGHPANINKTYKNAPYTNTQYCGNSHAHAHRTRTHNYPSRTKSEYQIFIYKPQVADTVYVR